MLRKPNFAAGSERDPVMDDLLAIVSGGKTTTELRDGVYECGHFNFENELGEQTEKYGEYGHLNAYGVCDSADQLLAAYDFEADPRSICISLVRLDKATQPSDGGWRWHKWGPYIGTQAPQREYLHDEPTIETVYAYHIYTLTSRTATV